MNLQYKWDVYLITGWFNHPGCYMYNFRESFLKKYNISLDECAGLIRFPKGFVIKRRLQPWICGNLPILGKILFEKGIEDVFDLADKLKESSYDIAQDSGSMIEKKDRSTGNKTDRDYKRHVKIHAITENKWESYKKSNQWHIVK